MTRVKNKEMRRIAWKEKYEEAKMGAQLNSIMEKDTSCKVSEIVEEEYKEFGRSSETEAPSKELEEIHKWRVALVNL